MTGIQRIIYQAARWALMCLVTLGVWSCRDTVSPIDTLPWVFVNETIFLNSIEALPLQQRDGGWIYHPGGLKGLIIYRVRQGDFRAFERQSTAEGGCTVRVDQTQLFMVDTCTQTQFDFDGFNVRGQPVRPLRQYRVSISPTTLVITSD